MAARGHVPPAYEGRSVQAPGMMRHGPFPGLVPVSHRPLEPLPPPEFMENKMAVQAAEMERLVRENQRLAATHVALRQELVATQQEMQRVHTHSGSIQKESDAQVRGLLEKLAKIEAELRAAESVKKELQQAHLEAQSLVTAKQELTAQIQQTTEELQKAHADMKKFPEMHAELDGLRQEHQKLRAAFEYEKGSNMEQVEQMRAMERNLISMAREVEKLRAEVLSAEKRAQHAPTTYESTYASVNPAYGPVTQGIGYADGGFSQGMAYADSGFGHGGGYSNVGYVQGAPGIPPNAYTRPQVQVQMTGAAAAGEGMNPYGSSGGGIATYDAARATASAQR